METYIQNVRAEVRKMSDAELEEYAAQLLKADAAWDKMMRDVEAQESEERWDGLN